MYRTDTLSISPLIGASPLVTKESRLPETVSFLRPSTTVSRAALDKVTDEARGHYQSLRNKSQLMRSFNGRALLKHRGFAANCIMRSDPHPR
jgi:hypothetical protein